jgi:hypothetical protein
MNRWQTIIGVIALSFGLHANAQTDYLNLNNDSTLWNLHSGSTDKVTEDRMNKGLVTNPLNALSGQAAGVNVASSGADRMAMLSSVRVRGTTSLTGGNDPLVIIDGVSSDLATLSTIYPADIGEFHHSQECSRDCTIRFTWCIGCHRGDHEERTWRTVPHLL